MLTSAAGTTPASSTLNHQLTNNSNHMVVAGIPATLTALASTLLGAFLLLPHSADARQLLSNNGTQALSNTTLAASTEPPLSSGQITGIILGTLAALIILGCLGYCCSKIKQNQTNPDSIGVDIPGVPTAGCCPT